MFLVGVADSYAFYFGPVRGAINDGESRYGRTRRGMPATISDLAGFQPPRDERGKFCEIPAIPTDPVRRGFDGECANAARKHVLVGEPFARAEQLSGRQTVDDALRGHVRSSKRFWRRNGRRKKPAYATVRERASHVCVRKPRANERRA